jgi:hypothetical protein
MLGRFMYLTVVIVRCHFVERHVLNCSYSEVTCWGEACNEPLL